MTKEQFDKACQLTSDIDSLQHRIKIIDEMKESGNTTSLYNPRTGSIHLVNAKVLGEVLATVRNGLTSELKQKQDELMEL